MGKRHGDELAAACARRKALRLAKRAKGEDLRARPKITYFERELPAQRPTLRYQPAGDGTRRGIPNGLPISWLSPSGRWQRMQNEIAKRKAWAAHPYQGKREPPQSGQK